MNTERVHNTKVGDAGHGEIDTGKSIDIRKAATNAIHKMILQGRMPPTTPREREMLEDHRKLVERNNNA
tara:strand:+ start:553 stop:759 length:207 start_codon:yes stop_codon:yes gene_type:complete